MLSARRWLSPTTKTTSPLAMTAFNPATVHDLLRRKRVTRPRPSAFATSPTAQIAERQRNTVNCKNGWNDCDHSRLTRLEAREVQGAEHQRNLSDCKAGLETCEYSKLTEKESGALAIAEHLRNFQACLKGLGYCDRSRLSPSESKDIPDTSSVPA